MSAFTKGDGRSRAAAWSQRTAGTIQRYAEKQGLFASDPQCSAWGSHYMRVECPRDAGCGHCEKHGEHATNIRRESITFAMCLEIRVANHAECGGPTVPDINLHNEHGDAAARIVAAKAIIKQFAADHVETAP